MPAVFSALLKPEYLFRPSQIFHRLFHTNITQIDDLGMVTLPWQRRILLKADDNIGRAIVNLGVYDLPLTECIYRTLQSDSSFCDIGANIGYVTALASAKIGASGEIHSFECSPLTLDILRKNVAEWREKSESPISLHEIALSDEAGTADLYMPRDYEKNDGVATLSTDKSNIERIATVNKARLDDLIDGQRNWVIKLDVEGHELNVLQGAQKLFAAGKIQTVFYEDFDIYPSQVAKFLLEQNMHIYRIRRSLSGPLIEDPIRPGVADHQANAWEPTNYVAMIDKNALLPVLRAGGWQVLA